MRIADKIAGVLGADPEKVAMLLRRIAEEGDGVLVDVGGLRGSVRHIEGRRSVLLEKYLVLVGAAPEDLLQ